MGRQGSDAGAIQLPADQETNTDLLLFKALGSFTSVRPTLLMEFTTGVNPGTEVGLG